MNNTRNEQKPETGECGPGCRCGTSAGGSRTKWMICVVVALAAAGVVTARVSANRAADAQKNQDVYAPVVSAVGMEIPTPTAGANAWGAPLMALSELNEVAADTEAVFVILPSSDADRTAAIQKEVAAAAETIRSRGTRMGTFLLSHDAQDAAGLAQQVGTPSVLAMYKGRGMAVVRDQELTQDSLLKAFVGSSRPSGCGPSSSCAPSAGGCR